jgi:hypothetical protein
LDAVVLLEQTEPGKFVRHSLERITCDHPTADVADMDDDGRPDIVTGSFSTIAAHRARGEILGPPRSKAWVTIWKNAAAKAPGTR